jgi:nitroimidazol reductase NimA-like FMN-containing flavoprotein (pyridoxamine 5'-phosphate oxidase superfamily)
MALASLVLDDAPVVLPIGYGRDHDTLYRGSRGRRVGLLAT